MTHSIYDLSSLLCATRSGDQPNYLFFWGHKPSADGSIIKSCLSQWYASPFTLDGITYPTAEHFMMAEKARLFQDEAALAQILQASSPDKAKRIGRAVNGFDDSLWNAQRFEVVVCGNHAKFSQNPDLKQFLLHTGDRVLVEASPQDRIWGIGLAADDPRASNPEQWLGLNLLGFALMRVRDMLGL